MKERLAWGYSMPMLLKSIQKPAYSRVAHHDDDVVMVAHGMRQQADHLGHRSPSDEQV